MKLTWKDEHAATVIAEHPDESMKQYFAQKIRDAWTTELDNFIEEVRVAVRNLKCGESVTLTSKPIVVNIENPAYKPGVEVEVS